MVKHCALIQADISKVFFISAVTSNIYIPNACQRKGQGSGNGPNQGVRSKYSGPAGGVFLSVQTKD